MGRLEFGGQPVNGPLAVFVFPSSHGHKGKAKEHTETRNKLGKKGDEIASPATHS
jgi:hypothetical protein